ncbi:MAG: hypothetical protein PHS54_03565 [Clostridia bacterium]|nr:hypothetical protein [Clostridia bacterium]
MKKGMVGLIVDTKSKEFMFNLGVLFASGKSVRILNSEEVDKTIEEEKIKGFVKSFNMMIKFWQDNDFAPNIGIDNELEENKIFLICPVRNATDEEKKILNDILEKYESKGLKVHFPPRNTNQDPHENGINTGGYSICLANGRAISSSKTIAVHYNKESTGSMFDLGVTYQSILNKPDKKFILENKFEYDKNDPIDKIIMKLLSKNNVQKLTKEEVKE